MTIVNFTKDIYDRHSSFYVLSHLNENAEQITAKMLTTGGEIDFDKKYSISKLPNGMFLFSSIITRTMGDCFGLVVSDGENSEIVNLQAYEKMRRFIKNPDNGFFSFFNSLATTSLSGSLPKEERCDYGMYGPVRFLKDQEPKISLVNVNNINIFEKILSVDGVGHIVYIKAPLDYNFFTNNDPFPRCATSLQESLKQISEWAAVTESPWNNEENIAIKAREFFDKLYFDQNFIEHINETQATMQVYNYLLGSADARSRPLEIGPMTKIIKENILKRMSHICLTNILSLYEIELDSSLSSYITQTEFAKLNGMKKIEIDILGMNEEIQNINDDNIDSIRIKIKEDIGQHAYNMSFHKLELISNFAHVLAGQV